MPTVRAVLFDFVNTLVPLRETEFLLILQKVHDYLHPLAPHVPFDTLLQHYVRIRGEQYARNLPLLRENDFYERMETLWNRVTGCPANPRTVRLLMDAYTSAFESIVSPAAYVLPVVHRLSQRYLLGVLSNYPYAPCVHRVLNQHGITRFLVTAVVSAEVGIVKPHPDIFRLTAFRMGVEPQAILYVGDDWCTDVLGATRAGMRAVYTREWRTETDPCENHPEAQPIAQISSLNALPELLDKL